jgi:glycosyltransferase involved in cell wall biosynthesis
LLGILASHASLAPGMEAHVALCFEGALSQELRASGARLHMLAPARLSRPWTVLRTQHRLGRLLAAVSFDVVILHNYWPHLILGPVAMARGIPLVFFAHEVPGGHGWLERVAGQIRPRMVLANSRQSASLMHTVFPCVRTEVYAGPVLPIARESVRPRAEVRAELGAPPDATVILHAARLAPWKGHESLLRALALLRGTPGWRCWITSSVQQAGDAAYLAKLEALAITEGIADRVRFLGDQADVASLMVAADIHCQPNETPEPWGRVFVEALYAGLPVVTTAIGGALEIVDASCGVLVPPREPRLLAEALGGLIADGGRRRALGAAGPARAASLADPLTSIRRLETMLRADAVECATDRAD